MTQTPNPKPGYKQTPIGVIPEEWEVRKLEEMYPPEQAHLAYLPKL